MKSLRFFLVVFLCAFVFKASAQLTIGAVDPGPYTPRSNIAATFTINPATCIPTGNIFRMYLSDASGNFNAPLTQIGQYNGFYSIFVNGTIPDGTPSGTGYKIRIVSSSTGLSADSGPLVIDSSLPVVQAQIMSNKGYLANSNSEAFGFCSPQTGASADMIFINQSSGSVTTTLTNELDHSVTNLNINPQVTFRPQQAHYTLFVKVGMPNGTVATKAYFVINNKTLTSLNTTGSNTVCLPGGALSYPIDVSSIEENFPGDTYRVDWGDGATDIYTICDLKVGSIKHTYNSTSCGRTNVSGNVTTYNAFGINLQLVSPFCGNIGTPISTTAKVLKVTQTLFSGPSVGCTNTNITFTNNSVLGDDPNNTGPSCRPDNATFNWYVDGSLIPAYAGVSRATPFVYRFATNGIHTITLEAISSTPCQSPVATQQICIQNAPSPAFTVPSLICTNTAVTPVNNSVVDPTNCNTDVTYTWSISPTTGVTPTGPVVTTSATPPTYNFTTPGKYTIQLQITSPSCGTFLTPAQTITVNASRTVDLSNNTTLCGLGTYDFSPAGGQTRTVYSGDETVLDDVYSWTVTRNNSGSRYTFITSSTSKYPRIRFDDYDTYTVTSTVTNICGTQSDSQVITFAQSPAVDVSITTNPICYKGTANLTGTISGNYVSFQWLNSSGTSAGFSDPTSLTTTYTPTTSERDAEMAQVTLRVNTGIPGNCEFINKIAVINIKPKVTLNSPSAKSICTGTSVDYTPTSSNTTTTYTWTAFGSTDAGGYADGNGIKITDILTNSSATTSATVTYTITPTVDGCTGDPFIINVEIKPRPIATATAANSTICSGQSTNITLTSNLSSGTTTYTWVSTAPPSITGTNSTTGSSINDILTNNGTSPATVTYTITPTTNGCSGTPITISISVEPQPTQPDLGTDQLICNQNTYTLKSTPINVGTRKWTVVPANPAINFDDDTSETPLVSGLQPGNSYTFRLTVTGAASCNAKFDDIVITVNLPSVGGTANAVGSQSVCAGSNSGQITLSGNVGTILRWQSSSDGISWTTDIPQTSSTLTYSNLTSTTYYRAVVQNGVCPIAYSNAVIITVNQPGVVADAGSPQTLCNEQTTTLAGNQPGSTDTGIWTKISGPSVTIDNPSQYNTTISGLVLGTYVFRWTITGVSCPPTNDDVTIVNLGPLTNNAISTPTTNTCTGQVITLTGTTPAGGSGTYTYIWESSPNGNAPWTVINGQTGKDLNVTVTGTMSYRRTANSGACTNISNSLTIIALPPIANNTITGNQTICATQTPNAIIGSSPTGGNGTNYTYGWEQSADGVVWVFVPGATGPSFSPPTLTETTFYRRLVSSGTCTGAQQSVSNPVTITVNQNARAEFTWTNDVGCVPYVLDANNIKAVPYPSQNSTYTWYAGSTQIGTGITFPGYTISTFNTDVVIRLVVTSSTGCLPSEMTHAFSTRENIVASFTQSNTEVCGSSPVTFTNTTLNVAGNTYEWLIDGVSVSTARDLGARTFATDPAGKDKTYIIVLKVKSTCGSDETQGQVTVKATPIPAISAVNANGCSPFTAEFINTSPGGINNTYTVDFGDGSAPVGYAFGDPIRHTYTTTVVKDFEVRMTATNQCASITSDPILVRVSPNSINPIFFAPPTEQTVCVGVDVTFRNNTSGAKDFSYDFKDGTSVVSHPNAYLPETITHRFLKAGTYQVTMTAKNDCSTNSASQTIVVLETPTATFGADITIGCEGLRVAFTQTNTGAVSYLWDFGDGTTSTDANPIHRYNIGPGQYTVKLTVINSLGCPYTFSRQNYITIVPPPTVNFSVSPGTVLSIPDYTFKFTNETSGSPQTYKWSFGDGDISTQKDPTHLYADTGKYLVTLRAYNQYGCVDSAQKYVQIVGIPGYTFVPNAFVPGGTSIPLQKFMGIGSGMKSWKMTIFNKWGQVLWQTTKLEDGKPVEGWDGTYNGVPQPQGIYFWKIEVELLNGSEWKGMSLGGAPPRRTGEIYLIR